MVPSGHPLPLYPWILGQAGKNASQSTVAVSCCSSSIQNNRCYKNKIKADFSLLEQLPHVAHQAWSAQTTKDVPRRYGNQITTLLHTVIAVTLGTAIQLSGDPCPHLPGRILPCAIQPPLPHSTAGLTQVPRSPAPPGPQSWQEGTLQLAVINGLLERTWPWCLQVTIRRDSHGSHGHFG